MTNNILILAAGRVRNESLDSSPFLLSELDGELLVERIFKTTTSIRSAKYYSAVLEDDLTRFAVGDLLSQLIGDITIVKVPEDTMGSACTALLAAVQMNRDAPLLILSSNELVKLDLSEVVKSFEVRGLDAGTLVFKALHPRYSFVRLNEQGLVEEAAQNRPISQHATTGIFWFARTDMFIRGAMALIRKGNSHNGKFYIAPVFNELILHQGRIGVFTIPQGSYLPLKNEHQANIYGVSDR